jgi:hypothetical protein
VAVLLHHGSGIESILSDEAVVSLAVGMLKEETGPLDEGYVGKVNSIVSLPVSIPSVYCNANADDRFTAYDPATSNWTTIGCRLL